MKGRGVGSWLFFLLVVAIGGIFMIVSLLAVTAVVLGGTATFGFLSITNAEHYQAVYQSPLTVAAVVTHHDSYTDSDDDTTYYSYIAYFVEDTLYQNVQYQSTGSESKLLPVGEKLEIVVSPNDPSQTMDGLRKSGRRAFLIGLVPAAVIALIYVAILHFSRTKKASGIPEERILQRDLRLTVLFGRRARPTWLVFWVTLVLFRWRYPCFTEHRIWMPIAAAVFFVFWLISVVRMIQNLKWINDEEYELKGSVLVNKEIKEDSESADTYILYYQVDGRNWSSTVDSREYNAATIGETKVISVHFPGKVKPVLYYDSYGKAR